MVAVSAVVTEVVVDTHMSAVATPVAVRLGRRRSSATARFLAFGIGSGPPTPLAYTAPGKESCTGTKPEGAGCVTVAVTFTRLAGMIAATVSIDYGMHFSLTACNG